MSKKTEKEQKSAEKKSPESGSATTETKRKKPISDFDAAWKAIEALPNFQRLPDGFATILPFPNNKSR